MRVAAGAPRRRWGAHAPVLLVALGATLLPTAIAQYVSDPSSEDEKDSIRYFGSAKDASGAVLPAATILITHKSSSFVFVTDEAGRFRGHLPLQAVAGQVSVKCFKADFEPVRLTKRAGPAGARPSVQVDCILRATAGAAPRE
jgi:hypothetical protein